MIFIQEYKAKKIKTPNITKIDLEFYQAKIQI